jgi:hypothetical protein
VSATATASRVMQAEDPEGPDPREGVRLTQADRRAARIIALALEEQTGMRWTTKALR